jgi:hypothetical protein
MDISQTQILIASRSKKGVILFIVILTLALLSVTITHAALPVGFVAEQPSVTVPYITLENEIEFGETVYGSIDNPAEQDEYTFSGNVGDVILIRMNDTPSTGFGSEIHLYRPGGTLLCSDFDVNGYLAEIVCTLDASGTFTILAMDHFGNTTGTYSLHLQRTNNPGNAEPFALGTSISNTLTLPTEMQAYTFTGSENDVILMRMNDSPATGFGSEIRLYRPDGTLLCSDWDVFGALAQKTCNLDVNGTYTILTGDHHALSAGTYSFHAQRINNPENAMPVNFGTTITDTIMLPVGGKAYTFTGSENDIVLIRMMDTPNTGFGSEIRLYRPDGSLLCSAWDVHGSLAQQNCTLDTSGRFTLLALDHLGRFTGDYGLHIQRVNNPGNAVHISKNVSFMGEILLPTAVDAYLLNGTINDVLQIRMNDVPSSGFSSEIRLYRPDGTLLCSAWTVYGGLVDVTCTLDLTSTFTLLAMDRSGRYTNPYSLSLTCIGCAAEGYPTYLPLVIRP